MRWLAGLGPGDPALSLAHVIQQARRLQLPLWILHVDLATMFPRLDRGVVAAAEAFHGLPREVSELARTIYGHALDPEGAVRCRYDTAAGLGDAFTNWMGALMGDPLNPDKAKLVLNSVVHAIQAVVKGFELAALLGSG